MKQNRQLHKATIAIPTISKSLPKILYPNGINGPQARPSLGDMTLILASLHRSSSHSILKSSFNCTGLLSLLRPSLSEGSNPTLALLSSSPKNVRNNSYLINSLQGGLNEGIDKRSRAYGAAPVPCGENGNFLS